MNWKDIWTEKYRPTKLEDIFLSPQIKEFMETLKTDSKDTGGVPNMLLSGPPGCGKSSLAKIIAEDILECQYLYINGSEETSIDVVRTKIMGFAQTKSFDGKIKLIILDEADGLSGSNVAGRSSAQQALKNVIEEYSSNTRFLFTSNYPDRITEAIHSRVLHLTFKLDYKDCLKQSLKVLKAEGVKIPSDQVEKLQNLVAKLAPDLRNILIQLQKSSLSGTLNITEVTTLKSYSASILKALTQKTDVMRVRESVIKNENGFNLDYHELLKCLFLSILDGEVVTDPKVKIVASLIVSDAIVDHFSVADKEINFSACLFRLSQVL